jgi:hypothetical protein
MMGYTHRNATPTPVFYEAPAVTSEATREPTCPVVSIPFQHRIGSLGLTLCIHPTVRRTWNVFEDAAGWVGCLRVDGNLFRVADHRCRYTDHATIFNAIVALIDAANDRQDWNTTGTPLGVHRTRGKGNDMTHIVSFSGGADSALFDDRVNPPSFYERDNDSEDKDRDYEGERDDAAYDAMVDNAMTGGEGAP